MNPMFNQLSSEISTFAAGQIASGEFIKRDKSGTIMFVEDSEDLRKAMCAFLAIVGFCVLPYSNAQDALEAFRKNPSVPDLLLTDIQMPGMTGIELARELTARRPELPVVLISASWISPELFAEFDQRKWPFLAKPVGFPTVLNTITQLLLNHSAELESAACRITYTAENAAAHKANTVALEPVRFRASKAYPEK